LSHSFGLFWSGYFGDEVFWTILCGLDSSHDPPALYLPSI
jgi:hypothetical protein